MLFINYKGNTPQQKYYSFGVKQNNNSNVIRFVLDVAQEDLDLNENSWYLKVRNKEHNYEDKIYLDDVNNVNGLIELTWFLTRKSTQFRNLELQLEYHNQDDVIWHTLIVELELSDTIETDKEISERNASEIEQLETEIARYNGRIGDLEKAHEILEQLKPVMIGNKCQITFPKNVAPLRFFNEYNGEDYYFDYSSDQIFIDNGETSVGNIIKNNDNTISAQFNNYNFDNINPNNDDIEYIYYQTWCGVNALNLFFQQSQEEQSILDQIEYIYNDDNWVDVIIFPQGIRPIFCAQDGGAMTFNYYNKTAGFWGQRMGDIFYEDGKIKIANISSYEAFNGKIDCIEYIKGENITDDTGFGIDFESLYGGSALTKNNYNVVGGITKFSTGCICADNRGEKYTRIVGGYEKATSTTALQNYPQNTLFSLKSTATAGVIFARKNMQSSDLYNLLQTNTYLDGEALTYYTSTIDSDTFVFIPIYISKSLTANNTIANSVNSNGGIAVSSLSQSLFNVNELVFIKTNGNVNSSATIKPIPLTSLIANGLYNHILSYNGDDICIVNKRPLPYNNFDELIGDIQEEDNNYVSIKINGRPALEFHWNGVDWIDCYYLNNGTIQGFGIDTTGQFPTDEVYRYNYK